MTYDTPTLLAACATREDAQKAFRAAYSPDLREDLKEGLWEVFAPVLMDPECLSPAPREAHSHAERNA